MNLIKTLLPIIVLTFNFQITAQNKSTTPNINYAPFAFTENKGQVHDQNNNTRPDVLFGGAVKGLAFHLKTNGMSYQLNKVTKWKTQKQKFGFKTKQKKAIKVADETTVYRVDIDWLGANKNVRVNKKGEQQGFNTYHINQNSCTVKGYEQVEYQNLYDKINLKWYFKNGNLEYDYVCEAGSDYKLIQLRINGAEQLVLNAKGDLVIKTPLGKIIEQAPVVWQDGRKLKSNWVIKTDADKKQTLSFNIQNLNNNLPYVIDPVVRIWGTYYGGTGNDQAASCATDASGNVFMTGSTASGSGTTIATLGAYQATLAGLMDVFVVKFNSAGVRQWGTYFGGSGTDQAYSCATDASGNIYISGFTDSNTGISTGGSHQTTFGGGFNDAFLAKFDGSGTLLWATYYGGNSIDDGYACATDASGNVYLAGASDYSVGTVIATTGSHQDVYGGGANDAFLAKFNSSGVRQWATYYGGTDYEFIEGCVTDAAGNIYLAGTTASTNNAISTAGSHQVNHAGGIFPEDAFLVKFNSAGLRQWGTYYGGTNDDYGNSLALDVAGNNVHLTGVTSSTNNLAISTAGAHQVANNLNADAFLVKFNSSGVRQWGTYYGGEGADLGNCVTLDASDNIFIGGNTTSTLVNSIATLGSYQTTIAIATNLGFAAKFNSAGVRQWGTYYGDFSEDGADLCIDANGKIYLTGSSTTPSGNGVATPGAHQTTYGGNTDAYLVQLGECLAAPTPTNTTPVANQTVCAATSATLSVSSGTYNVDWYPTPTSTVVIASGNTITTPTLAAGNYTFYAGATGGCGAGSRVAITVTAFPTPTITATGGSVCPGQTFTINPSGAISYTALFSGGATTVMAVSPSVTTTYFVGGTSAQGCESSFVTLATLTVTVLPGYNLSVNSGTICNGQSFTINPSGAPSYTIQGGNAIVTPSITSTYSVTSPSFSNGCVSIANCTVTVETAPTISLATNTASFCYGQTYTIPVSGAASYTAVFPGNATTVMVVSPSVNTLYYIGGSSANGCISLNTLTLNLTVLPSPIISLSNSVICDGVAGQSYTISPSGASSYSVQGGSMVVTPTTSSTYTVIGAGTNGCISANTVAYGVYFQKDLPYVSVPAKINGVVGSNGEYDLQINAELKNVSNFSFYNANDILVNNANYQSQGYIAAGNLSTTGTELFSKKISNSENISFAVKGKTGGCIGKSSSTEVLIRKKLMQEPIPNFFSPNSDGQNDVWAPQPSTAIEAFDIIDSEGKLVYRYFFAPTYGYGIVPVPAWHGFSFEYKPGGGVSLAPNGVYTYELTDTEGFKYRGTITLKR